MTFFPFTKDDDESFFCTRLVGMTYEDACKLMADCKYQHFVVRKDGIEQPFPYWYCTLEANPSGIGLEVNDKHVVSAFPHKKTGNWRNIQGIWAGA